MKLCVDLQIVYASTKLVYMIECGLPGTADTGRQWMAGGDYGLSADSSTIRDDIADVKDGYTGSALPGKLPI